MKIEHNGLVLEATGKQAEKLWFAVLTATQAQNEATQSKPKRNYKRRTKAQPSWKQDEINTLKTKNTELIAVGIVNRWQRAREITRLLPQRSANGIMAKLIAHEQNKL